MKPYIPIFIVSLIDILLIEGCQNQCLFNPPIINNYPGCICPNQKYTYTLPAGNPAVDLLYQTKGEFLMAEIFQNGTISSCLSSESCVKRNVQLNENFPYSITVYQSEKNQDEIWLNLFQINPRLASPNNNVPYLNPPELNIDSSDQDGMITANVTYNYTLPADDVIWIDMEFIDNITISVIQNDVVIASYYGTYVYDQVYLPEYAPYVISVSSSITSNIKRFKIESNSIFEYGEENIQQTDNEINRILLITALSVIIVILILILIIFWKYISKNKYQSLS